MAKILICDDHPFTLMGTQNYIESIGHHVCEACDNGISAYNMILQHNPDIALLDVSVPGMNGLEILERLQTVASVRTKVILLTMHKEMSIFKRARDLNAKGYVLKEFSMNVLEECINAVLQGEIWFSPELTNKLQIDTNSTNDRALSKLTFSEKKILELIGQQHTTRDIAHLLFIAEKTVENHRSNIMKKLDLPAEKNALLIWAVQNLANKGN
jgi:DNA-binding NarL/FixJ family response regulator